MRNLLVRRPDFIVLLLTGYFLLEFAVRVLMPDGLRYDESQQAFFSQWLALGYDSQPPLYNWFQTAVVSAFGLSITTIAAVKNFVLLLVYLSYYKLARIVLQDRLFAVIATLSLLTIPQLFWEAQRDLTHTVAQMLAINLLLYGVIKTLKAPSLKTYGVVGLALGLGMLTKYNFALIAVAALVAVWLHPNGRARIFDKRFLLSVAIAAVLFLPHALWLLDNFAVASGRTLGIMEQDAPKGALAKLIQGPFKFLRLAVVIIAPTFVVYCIVFGKSFLRNLRETTVWTRFFDAIFLTIAVIVLVLIVTIGMTALRDRWLLPFLFLVPIYFCLKMQAAGIRPEDFARRFLVVPLVMMLLIPIALFVRINFPTWFGSYQAYNVPYATFAKKVVAEEGKRPGLIMTNDWLAAGNMRLQMSHTTVMSLFFANLTLEYDWTAEQPVLLVWLSTKDAPPAPSALRQWVTQNLGTEYAGFDAKLMAIPYARGKPDDMQYFGYSWIYPKQVAN